MIAAALQKSTNDGSKLGNQMVARRGGHTHTQLGHPSNWGLKMCGEFPADNLGHTGSALLKQERFPKLLDSPALVLPY